VFELERVFAPDWENAASILQERFLNQIHCAKYEIPLVGHPYSFSNLMHLYSAICQSHIVDFIHNFRCGHRFWSSWKWFIICVGTATLEFRNSKKHGGKWRWWIPKHNMQPSFDSVAVFPSKWKKLITSNLVFIHNWKHTKFLKSNICQIQITWQIHLRFAVNKYKGIAIITLGGHSGYFPIHPRNIFYQ
jgi:hypothetical protein